jgi:hypothetical protein
MKKQTRSHRKYLPYLAIVALVLSSLACNLANVIQNEGYEEPRYREEEHFDEGAPRPEEEEHFEEEEPFHEEDPDFEEHHEEGEPHHEEDPHFEEEHHEEGEPHHEEENHEEECPPESECPGGPGGEQGQGEDWTTDVAVTDIYPGNQPHGQFHVRITNHGPGTLDNVQVDLRCGFDSMDKNTGKVGPGEQVEFSVTLGMQPGESQKFPTGLDLDTSVYEYGVGCEVFPGFHDPNQGNNYYHEVVK